MRVIWVAGRTRTPIIGSLQKSLENPGSSMCIIVLCAQNCITYLWHEYGKNLKKLTHPNDLALHAGHGDPAVLTALLFFCVLHNFTVVIIFISKNVNVVVNTTLYY